MEAARTTRRPEGIVRGPASKLRTRWRTTPPGRNRTVVLYAAEGTRGLRPSRHWLLKSPSASLVQECCDTLIGDTHGVIPFRRVLEIAHPCPRMLHLSTVKEFSMKGKRKAGSRKRSQKILKVIHFDAAGIDIGSK